MTRLAHARVLILIGAAVALLGRPTPVTAQTALLEVDAGEEGEVKRMQVNDDGGLVVRGALNQGVIPAFGPGIRLMWYPKKAAFRAGTAIGAEWDDANVGRSSVAMGTQTTARGDGATALGVITMASGSGSTAMGSGTTAGGHGSTAMGGGTTAGANYSTAMGAFTKATGPFATAMGNTTQAGGNASTAMGTNSSATGTNAVAMGSNSRAFGAHSVAMGTNAVSGIGSFVFADNSAASEVFSLEANQFVVRAAGGFRFRSSPTLNTGCDIPAGEAAINCTSSRLAKEGFEDLDGEAVLGKLAAIPIQRWRYRGTDALHVGPTAEDFHAAFGLGQGPTTISTVDAGGISLFAVQALERRTAELREENAELRGENAALRAKLAEDTAALRTEVEALRRIMETGRVAP